MVGVAHAVSVFNSNQVGTSPVAGSVLQTNGSTSQWVTTSSLGISGSAGTVSTSSPGLTQGQWVIAANGSSIYSTSSQPIITLTAATTTITVSGPSPTGTAIIGIINLPYITTSTNNFGGITTSTWVINASGTNFLINNWGGSSTAWVNPFLNLSSIISASSSLNGLTVIAQASVTQMTVTSGTFTNTLQFNIASGSQLRVGSTTFSASTTFTAFKNTILAVDGIGNVVPTSTPTSGGASGVATATPIFTSGIPFFIAGGASGTIQTNSGLTFVSSTGVLSAPTATITGTLLVGTTTNPGNQQLAVVNTAGTCTLCISATTTPLDFSFVVTPTATPNNQTLFTATNTLFAIASSGIPYINGTSTISIGGGILSSACTSTVTLIPLLLSSTTDQVFATPQNDPGGITFWKPVISRSGATSSDITTFVCEPSAALTPGATRYNLSWWRNIGK